MRVINTLGARGESDDFLPSPIHCFAIDNIEHAVRYFVKLQGFDSQSIVGTFE